MPFVDGTPVRNRRKVSKKTREKGKEYLSVSQKGGVIKGSAAKLGAKDAYSGEVY